MERKFFIPKPDVKDLLLQLNCQPSTRNHYIDWGNSNRDILKYLLNRPIDDPVSAENVVDYALATGKDVTEGGWFYYNLGLCNRKDSVGNIHYAGGTISNEADLKAKEIRMFEDRFERLDKVIRLAQKVGLGVRADLLSFFTEVYLGMGYEKFFLALYDNRKFVEYFLDYMLELYLKLAERLIKYPIDLIMIDTDLCDGNGPMVSPKILEEIWLPRMRQLVNVFHKRNLPVVFHCDGRLEKVLEYFIEIGIKAIHPIEPGFNDIYALKEQYKGKICLIGNIDIVNVLIRGTREEVVNDIKTHLSKLSVGGGYIVSTSTSHFSDDIPIENFVTMIREVYN